MSARGDGWLTMPRWQKNEQLSDASSSTAFLGPVKSHQEDIILHHELCSDENWCFIGMNFPREVVMFKADTCRRS